MLSGFFHSRFCSYNQDFAPGDIMLLYLLSDQSSICFYKYADKIMTLFQVLDKKIINLWIFFFFFWSSGLGKMLELAFCNKFIYTVPNL